MARFIVVLRGTTSSGEPFEARATVREEFDALDLVGALGEVTQSIPVAIRNLGGGEEEPPETILSAHILDLPSQMVAGDTATLRGELRNQFGAVIEEFDPERWLFVVLSGPADLVDNELTALAQGSVVVSASHLDQGVSTTRNVSVLAAPVVAPALFEAEFSGESNGTPLASITTASGHTFAVGLAGSQSAIETLNGALISTSGESSYAAMVGDPPPVEYDHHFTFQYFTNVTNLRVGVIARGLPDLSSGSYWFYYDGANSRWSISNWSGNVFASTPATLEPGVYECRARIRNASKSLDVRPAGGEWVQVATVNDNSVVGGMPGVFMRGAMGASTGAHLSSFEGTDPAALEVVAQIYAPAGVLVEDSDQDIRARLIDVGGTVTEPYNPAEWTFAVESGPASIGGPDNDVLQVGSAPGTIVLSAEHSGTLTAEVSLDVIAAPVAGDTLTPASLEKIIGPLVARGTFAHPALTTYDTRFNNTEELRFCGTNGSYRLDCVNLTGGQGRIASQHYGAMMGRLLRAIRDGDPYGAGVTSNSTRYGRGRTIIRDYLYNYAQVNEHALQPHNNTGLHGIAAYYVLENDPVARTHIWVEALAATGDSFGYMNFTNANSDARQPAVRLQAARLSHELGIPYAKPPVGSRGINAIHGSWLVAGRWLIDHMLTPTGNPFRGYIGTTGEVWSTAHAGQVGTANNEAYLFNAMMAEALLQWWGWTDQYAPAFTAARKIVDHLVDVEQDRIARGFGGLSYLSGNGSRPDADDLAGFYIWPSLVLWQETGDSKYREFALRSVARTNLTSSISNVKQWNEVFSRHAQGAEALLSGAPWR